MVGKKTYLLLINRVSNPAHLADIIICINDRKNSSLSPPAAAVLIEY
jgi:hypothetical protein